MKTNLTKAIILITLATIGISSCKKEEYHPPACDGSQPTYNSVVKSIIDANCMGAFCHKSGSKRSDFTNYTGLEPVLSNDAFKRRVLEKQDMPKGNGRTLTQEEINILQCWADNGFPEN